MRSYWLQGVEAAYLMALGMSAICAARGTGGGPSGLGSERGDTKI